jgi:hypothetical protein
MKDCGIAIASPRRKEDPEKARHAGEVGSEAGGYDDDLLRLLAADTICERPEEYPGRPIGERGYDEGVCEVAHCSESRGGRLTSGISGERSEME